MVEKIRRDVRITTIYEGTSEILEMTISRDRWQEHLKSRGQHYHQLARELETLHGRHAGVGADVAALAGHALAEALEAIRLSRLTRHQHVLLRIGALVAEVEVAMSFARHAARAAEGTLCAKSPRRLRPPALALASRVFAREVALRIGGEGHRWGGGDDALAVRMGLPAIHRAQAGLLADLDALADALYDRPSREGTPS
jgi:alkylation response protein AidB-like acyl-CoA dehydrogenase